jgi:predicted RNase H-like HicB family nuclease
MEEPMNEEENVQETNDIEAVREVVLSAYPDCVPELVQGETVAEVLASVEQARAAYVRVAATLPAPETAPIPPMVPAGGSNSVTDPSDLPAAEKVRRGIANHRR